MKKLLILFTIAFPTYVLAGDSIPESFYKPDIKNCDQQFKRDISENGSNASMDTASDNQIKCYENAAHKIIDKYYSKQSKMMKEDLRHSITAFHKTSQQMHRPDSCYGQCGSIAALSAYSSTLKFMKLYIDELVKSANTNW